MGKGRKPITYGGISKSETNLTNFSNQVNTMGAAEQQTAANEQATAEYSQASYSVQYAAEQAEQTAYTTSQQAGNQAEGYASGGVSPGEGTPLSVLNTTRAMGQIQENAYTLQGQLQAQLARTQGDIYQQSGLEAVLSAEGQNQAATQNTQIQQAIRNTQQLDSLLGTGVSVATSLASAFIVKP